MINGRINFLNLGRFVRIAWWEWFPVYSASCEMIHADRTFSDFRHEMTSSRRKQAKPLLDFLIPELREPDRAARPFHLKTRARRFRKFNVKPCFHEILMGLCMLVVFVSLLHRVVRYRVGKVVRRCLHGIMFMIMENHFMFYDFHICAMGSVDRVHHRRHIWRYCVFPLLLQIFPNPIYVPPVVLRHCFLCAILGLLELNSKVCVSLVSLQSLFPYLLRFFATHASLTACYCLHWILTAIRG
jgi:hypothetical protein